MSRLGGGAKTKTRNRDGTRSIDLETRRLTRQVATLKRALAVCRSEVEAATRQKADRVAEHWGLQVREVDHRAKNSLQLAASMLLIHGKTTEDAEVRKQLESAATRLTTLARLHAVLHERVSEKGVPLRPWLERVCEGLHMGQPVGIFIVAPDEIWPVEVARPVGLFTFEAVTNALKHGFRDGAAGRIDVSLVRQGTRCRLEVADDGSGPGMASCSGLGLTLCQIFADQLGGEFTMAYDQNDRGFRSGIAFAAPFTAQHEDRQDAARSAAPPS